MTDKEVMAAIGEVVDVSAVLDYSVAVLVAMTDGYREQDCEDHARMMVRSPGGAMRELRKRACAQLRGQGVLLQQIARRLHVAQEFSFHAEGACSLRLRRLRRGRRRPGRPGALGPGAPRRCPAGSM